MGEPFELQRKSCAFEVENNCEVMLGKIQKTGEVHAFLKTVFPLIVKELSYLADRGRFIRDISWDKILYKKGKIAFVEDFDQEEETTCYEAEKLAIIGLLNLFLDAHSLSLEGEGYQRQKGHRDNLFFEREFFFFMNYLNKSKRSDVKKDGIVTF